MVNEQEPHPPATDQEIKHALSSALCFDGKKCNPRAAQLFAQLSPVVAAWRWGRQCADPSHWLTHATVKTHKARPAAVPTDLIPGKDH